jgi:hypothetical protein
MNSRSEHKLFSTKRNDYSQMIYRFISKVVIVNIHFGNASLCLVNANKIFLLKRNIEFLKVQWSAIGGQKFKYSIWLICVKRIVWSKLISPVDYVVYKIRYFN